MKRFVAPLLALALGIVVAGWIILQSKTVTLTPMKGRVDIVEADRDPELAAAVMRARRELPQFIAALQKPKPGQTSFAVNGRFTSPEGPEHLWVTVDRYAGGQFFGKVADTPLFVPKLKKGDPIRVDESAVNDYYYREGTKIVGGYTMDVLLKRAQPK